MAVARQADERPFDGPNAALRGEQRRVYRAVRMIMVAVIWITMGVRMVDIAHKEIILLGDATRYSYDFGQTSHEISLPGDLPALLRSTQS